MHYRDRRRLIETMAPGGAGHPWLDAVALLPFGEHAEQRLTLIAEQPGPRKSCACGRFCPRAYTLAVLAQLPPGEIRERR